MVQTSDRRWLQYFQANSVEPRLPWDDAYRLTGAERAIVLPSIQQFQLGENAQGRRLLQAARVLGSDYLQVLRLFVREEQRHSAILGDFLKLQGARCLRHHWVHGVFHMIRGLSGLELCMRVLATAEVLAIPYYTALRDATGSPLLRAICTRILEEEAAHLHFQAFTFDRLGSGRSLPIRHIVHALHRWFLMATAILVWIEHRFVFLAGGYSIRRLLRQSLAEYQALTGDRHLLSP
jgi:hypothetical protein